MKFRKRELEEQIATKKELEEAQKRLRQTQQLWPEVYQTERWIQNALKGST